MKIIRNSWKTCKELTITVFVSWNDSWNRSLRRSLVYKLLITIHHHSLVHSIWISPLENSDNFNLFINISIYIFSLNPLDQKKRPLYSCYMQKNHAPNFIFIYNHPLISLSFVSTLNICKIKSHINCTIFLYICVHANSANYNLIMSTEHCNIKYYYSVKKI